VYHYLIEKYDIAGVVVDSSYKDSKLRMQRIQRRIKKVGFFTVFQQILFCNLIRPILVRVAKKRVNQMTKKFKRRNPIHHPNALEVFNINDKSTADYIHKIRPDLVIVHGTSIISSGTLSQIECPIINFHIGITPKYRGLHGGYWALYNRDKENFGSTVHFVDNGIDTGGIIVQKVIDVTKEDNFYTYQILQTIHCLDCFDHAIEKIANGYHKARKMRLKKGKKVSRFYSHPTIAQYLYGRLFLNVK